MLRADVVVGGLWGDEGKGKYVGGVCREYDAVLRVNASTNAGHRVCTSDGDSWTTRQLPSVFFPAKTLLVIAPGALLNPLALAEEVEGRPDLDRLRGRVKIASSVSLVIRPYREKGRGFMSNLIGSTHQGTGPSAVARAARHSLHLYDLEAVADGAAAQRTTVLEKLCHTSAETLPLRFTRDGDATRAYAAEVLDELVTAFVATRDLLGPFCVDYTRFLLEELHAADCRVLIEGCNGILLDNLHGAHPHTTSTSTNVGALICGANLPPSCVDRVVIVIASYTTCLGKRPFPTEMSADEAAHFYANCNEVDPAEMQTRRLGWVDLPALRKALSGAHGAVLHLNKLDVLSGLDAIRVATSYRLGEATLSVLPDDPQHHGAVEPVYEELPGWPEPLVDVRSWEALPENARRYVRALEGWLPNRIASLGVGPRNDDVVAVPPA